MTLTEITSTLERLGAAPLKRLGQNFLHDGNLARWIVGQLQLAPGDHLVELGPGLGALTAHLAQAPVSATLLEKDAAYVSFLRETFARENFEIVAGDALHCDPRRFFAWRPVKLVGMLPYYIASALLLHFTREPCPFSRVLVAVQREVADRLTARPGTAAYGSLSVALQRRWQVAKLRLLPASVFVPQPQVESALVLLTPKEGGSLSPVDASHFEALVRLGFNQRRKQLRKRLVERYGSGVVGTAWERLRLPPDVRAEDLSIEAWVALANGLTASRTDGNAAAELLQVVDGQDQPRAVLDRVTVHREGHLHRAVHVLLLNGGGELLLQRRSAAKDRFPGRWDSSAAGHVDAGEEYDACAARETAEELGLEVPLTYLGKLAASPATGQEFVAVYGGRTEGRPAPNPAEIDAFGAFPLEVVDAWSGRTPDDFAPAFLPAYDLARPHLIRLAAGGW